MLGYSEFFKLDSANQYVLSVPTKEQNVAVKERAVPKDRDSRSGQHNGAGLSVHQATLAATNGTKVLS